MAQAQSVSAKILSGEVKPRHFYFYTMYSDTNVAFSKIEQLCFLANDAANIYTMMVIFLIKIRSFLFSEQKLIKLK